MAEATAYSSFRLYITKNTAGSSGYMAVGEWRMWENYLPELEDPDFLVGGVASASAVGSSYVAANAFDKDSTTTWESPNTAGPKWLRYDLPTPKKPMAIFIQHATWPNEAPADFILQGSNDGGTTWVDIQTFKAFLDSSTAPVGRMATVGSILVSGTAMLADGRPASRVMLYDYQSGSLKDTQYPGPDGRYVFRPSTTHDVLLVVLGPAGFRPIIEGPITPLAVSK